MCGGVVYLTSSSGRLNLIAVFFTSPGELKPGETEEQALRTSGLQGLSVS